LSIRRKIAISAIGLLLLSIISYLVIDLFKTKEVKELDFDKRELSVKILNGCGVPGLARDYEKYLNHKFDEYDENLFMFSEPSNTRKAIYNKSVIVIVKDNEDNIDYDRVKENLEILQQRTGIEPWTYVIDEVQFPDYEFIIIIGSDFQNLMKK